MSNMAELDMMVSEGVELVESGMCLSDAMNRLREEYNFFVTEYDFIMMNIINRHPNHKSCR